MIGQVVGNLQLSQVGVKFEQHRFGSVANINATLEALSREFKLPALEVASALPSARKSAVVSCSGRVIS